MKMQDIFGTTGYLAGAVPLSIQELGFAYLNDIGLWNITINNKNVECIHGTIRVSQLLDIFEHHCSCFHNQNDVLEQEKQKMIEKIKAYDPNEIIELIQE